MLNITSIENNKITITCSLPMEMTAFKMANTTPGGEVLPMRVRYHQPDDASEDCRIVLTPKNKGASFYYEDMERLAALLSLHSTHTGRSLADKGGIEKLRSDARRTLPGRNTVFYPDKLDPKVQIMTTEDGLVKFLMLKQLPESRKIMDGLRAIYDKRCMVVDDRLFSTTSPATDRRQLEAAGDVLVENGIIPPEEKNHFVSHTRAAQARHFAAVELAHAQDAGEYVTAMHKLAKAGDFRALAPQELTMLQAVAGLHLDPFNSDDKNMEASAWLKKGVGNEREEEVASRFASFLPEINEALQAKMLTPGGNASSRKHGVPGRG